MQVKWQLKIGQGQWMSGTHTFRTKKAREEYIALWRKLENRSDAMVTRLRNGVEEFGEPVAQQRAYIPAAACPRCGGWTSYGGMSQHAKTTTPVCGRVGCTCHR